jgi:hypothetical protein
LLNPLWIIPALGVLAPIELWLMWWFMKWRGQEPWQPSKGLLLHLYVGCMLILCACGAFNYFGYQKNNAGLAGGGFFFFFAVASVWHGWHGSIVEKHESAKHAATEDTPSIE